MTGNTYDSAVDDKLIVMYKNKVHGIYVKKILTSDELAVVTYARTQYDKQGVYEALFIPSANKGIGYQFIFHNDTHIRLVLGENDMTDINMYLEICRFEYKIVSQSLVIKRIYDPLFIPSENHIQSDTVDILEEMEDYINDTIGTYCDYYNNHEV